MDDNISVGDKIDFKATYLKGLGVKFNPKRHGWSGQYAVAKITDVHPFEPWVSFVLADHDTHKRLLFTVHRTDIVKLDKPQNRTSSQLCPRCGAPGVTLFTSFSCSGGCQ